MLHFLFVALTWLIGIFGTGGALAFAVAAFWLGPSALLAIVEPIVSKFVACTKCVALVAAVIATVAAYWIGHHEVEKEWAAAVRDSKSVADTVDKEAARKAAENETQMVRAIEETARKQHDADLAEIERLKSLPVPDACLFGDDDIGLRNNAAGAGRKGAATGAKPSDKAAAGAAPKQSVWLSLVRSLGMQGKGRAGNAAANNQ